MNRLFRILAFAVALCCAAALASAQTITGVVSGTVADSSGLAVPGATVTLIHEGTGDVRTISTDVSGDFVFPSILPGAYTIKIVARGFQNYQRMGNQLTPNERLSLGEIRVTLGSVSETVTVAAEGANVQTASAEGSALLTTHQLDTLAKKGRDVVGMLNLLRVWKPATRWNPWAGTIPTWGRRGSAVCRAAPTRSTWMELPAPTWAAPDRTWSTIRPTR